MGKEFIKAQSPEILLNFFNGIQDVGEPNRSVNPSLIDQFPILFDKGSNVF